MNKLLAVIFCVLVVMMLAVSIILDGAEFQIQAGGSPTIYQVLAAVLGGLTIFSCIGAAVGFLVRDAGRRQYQPYPYDPSLYQEPSQEPQQDGTRTEVYS